MPGRRGTRPIHAARPTTVDRVNTTPERTCAACRGRESRDTLQRYVLVGGVPTLDAAKRLPGRGAWLHDNDECRALAVKRRSLERALRPRA